MGIGYQKFIPNAEKVTKFTINELQLLMVNPGFIFSLEFWRICFSPFFFLGGGGGGGYKIKQFFAKLCNFFKFQKRKAVSVTTNPYIGFQLGKLITEEYIEVPLDLFNTLNHHQLSNQQSISANCIRDDVSPQPRLGASLPTITQQASVEFSPSRLALDHVYSPSHIVQSHFQNDVTLPRLGSNSSESLTAFFVANQSSGNKSY